MSISAALVNSSETNKLTAPGKIAKPHISAHEILIRSVAFAANPTDWKHIAFGLGQKGDISGSDVSGIVEEVGSEVQAFKKGDVVSAFLRGGYSKEYGAFAEYVRVNPISAVKYDKLSDTPLAPGQIYPSEHITTYEGAASVTLGLVTVALSFGHALKLKADSTKAILIWGGATATGVLAIQIAKLLFGLKVITTASPKNHEWLKSLGADAVFDYNDLEVTTKILEYAQGSIAYAFDTISEGTTFQSLYDSTAGSEYVALDNLLGLGPENIKEAEGRKVSYGKTLAYLVFGKSISMGAEFTFTQDVLDDYKAIWGKVLEIVPQLKTSKLKVLAPGFETPAEALELLRQGKVSGEKLVWRAH